MTTRRAVLLALGVCVSIGPLRARAQTATRSYRIGTLSLSNATEARSLRNEFEDALNELGYVEGRNVVFERRYSDYDPSRLPGLATELMQQKVDLIMTVGNIASVAAQAATKTIPIVFVLVSDPTHLKLAASLARPGGNMTGTSLDTVDLTAKRLALLKELYPQTARCAVFAFTDRSTDPTTAAQLGEIERAAKILRIKVLPFHATARPHIEPALEAARKWRADTFIVLDSVVAFGGRAQLIDFAAKHRMPALYFNEHFVKSGGLISYGPNAEAMYRRTASYVDKILKGAKPGDLPIEQPTKFVLAINLKTAKALGIKIPQTILLQATKVIE